MYIKTMTEVPLKQGTEPPTAPWAPQYKWLPTAQGVCSRCVCSLLCVHFGWVKRRAQIPSMGTILGHMSRQFTWKIHVLSSFTHSRVFPNLNDLNSSVKHKRRYFEEYLICFVHIIPK